VPHALLDIIVTAKSDLPLFALKDNIKIKKVKSLAKSVQMAPIPSLASHLAIFVQQDISVQLLPHLQGNVSWVLIHKPAQQPAHLAMMVSSVNSRSKCQRLSTNFAQQVSIASWIWLMISSMNKYLARQAFIIHLEVNRHRMLV
jgi:hypothetical protein